MTHHHHHLLHVMIAGAVGLGGYEVWHYHQYGNFGFGNPYHHHGFGGYGLPATAPDPFF